MGAFAFAWVVGEGIICYRSIRQQGGPPWPGQLIISSGVFILAAAISEAGDNARKGALWLVWGLNIAAFYNLFTPSTPASQKPGTVQAAVSSLTLPSPALKGWWDKVTASTADPTSVFGGNCGAGAPGSQSLGQKIDSAIQNSPGAGGLAGSFLPPSKNVAPTTGPCYDVNGKKIPCPTIGGMKMPPGSTQVRQKGGKIGWTIPANQLRPITS